MPIHFMSCFLYDFNRNWHKLCSYKCHMSINTCIDKLHVVHGSNSGYQLQIGKKVHKLGGHSPIKWQLLQPFVFKQQLALAYSYY